MPKVYQAYNPRIKAWVKYRVMKNGRVRLLNTKESKPMQRFKGVPVRRKKKY